MEKRNNNNNTVISFMKENIKLKKIKKENDSPEIKNKFINLNASNNNFNNNRNSNVTNGFSSTKSNNLTYVKKQILSPIKEAPVNLNTLKLKIDKAKLSNESLRNLRNKTFSKIVLNPIIDNSSAANNSNINNNKSIISAYTNKIFVNGNYINTNNNKIIQDENSIIDEEPLKSKESDVFRMTQYDEKHETKNNFKKNATSNLNNVSVNTNASISEKGVGNETQSKLFSKMNSNNNLNFNNNNNSKGIFNNNFANNIIFKKLEINTFKHSNSAIDMFSTGNNDNSNNNFNSGSLLSPEASTKYISINQSSILNSNFNINSLNTNNFLNNNFSSTTNILNNNNNNKSTTNHFSSNLSEMEASQYKQNLSVLQPENFQGKGKELIQKIEQKVFNTKKDKYPLIPDLKRNLKFSDANPLKTIFFNCSDNLNITNKLFNYIGTQKNKKLKSKTIEKLKKKEREFYIEKDLKADMSFKNKVFVYGQHGGYYVSADFGHMQKYNLITKISENMAMNNRNFLTKQFDYDYKADEDYIYQGELREAYLRNLQEEKEKMQVCVDDKHRKVDGFLENTLKKSEILVQRIDGNLVKFEKERSDRNNGVGNGSNCGKEVNSGSPNRKKILKKKD